MRDPFKERPIRRMVKIRMNVGGRIVKHFFIGTLFGLLNETSHRIFMKKTPKEEEMEPSVASPQPEEIKVAETLYRKEEIFRRIDGKLHLSYKHNGTEIQFIKHFIYGSLIVFLGMEVTKYVRGFSFLKGKPNPVQVMVGIPLAILPYYMFCSFYNRKSVPEFWGKLKEDFLPLGAAKFAFDLSQINYAERIKSMPFDRPTKVARRLKRADNDVNNLEHLLDFHDDFLLSRQNVRRQAQRRDLKMRCFSRLLFG